MEGKKFNTVTKVTTVNSNQSVLLTDNNGNVTSIGMDALKADLAVGQHAWCGRVWNTANATPKAASYIGSLELLKELPYILGLGAYLVKNDHSRRKLDSKDHHKYATGEPARLDGTEGHYQWGWGRKFYVVIKDIGGLHYEQIGIKPIPGEYNLEIPIGSLSAAGFATIERSTGRLVSYINDAANYRGGDNDATYDGKSNTLLGRPVTAMTTEQFRAAARKNGKGWLCTTMRHTSIVAILFSVIFGTHYDQDAVNANKDANGLFQGGLGAGLTQMPNWETYNGYRPVAPMSAGIELGDSCGEATYAVKNDAGTTVYNAKIPCFFGYKNGFGNLWRMMDDEFCQVNSDKTMIHLVAPSIYGSWTIGNATGMKALSKSPGGDGFKAVTRAAAGLAADQDDLGVIAADLLPVDDLAGVNLCNRLNVKVRNGVVGMHDDCDTVVGQNGLLQATRFFLVFQVSACQTDVAGACLNCLDAGAGAGGVVGEGCAFVVCHERFAQSADDFFHGGRAVGRDGTGGGLFAAAGEQRGDARQRKDDCDDLFHLKGLLSMF